MRHVQSISQILLAAGLAFVPGAASLSAQSSVDLRRWQTPIKNQGGRSTCIVFSAVAALEAAYNRAGYGQLDLSEEFCNFMGKNFWLEPDWSKIAVRGRHARENQIGGTGGGNGAHYLNFLSTGLRIPTEDDFRYRTTDYPLPYPYNHSYWTQVNTSSFNLDPRNLPRKALTAGRYYSISSWVNMSPAASRDPAAIENVLRSGREVVWDFLVGGNVGTEVVWQPTSDPLEGLKGHSMLIVGYINNSNDPTKNVFVVKNSWGRIGAFQNGYTYISYAYLKRYGKTGGYITGVNRPAAWPELAFLGRYNMSFDGHRGTLDIYHVPGVFQGVLRARGVNIADRRLGAFHSSSGTYRVNGAIDGDKLTFWIKGSNPNMRWDEQWETPTLGRKFVYHMIDPVKGEIAGRHQDNPGPVANPPYGGYARIASTILGSDGFLKPTPNGNLNNPEQFLGRWVVAFDRTRGFVNVLARDDSKVHPLLRAAYAGLECEFVEPGTNDRHAFIGLVKKSRPSEISFTFTHSTRGRVSFTGYRLSWEPGVFAGEGLIAGRSVGIYGYRNGEALYPGVLTRIGTGCTGTNGKTLTHAVVGYPILGNSMLYYCINGPRSGTAVIATGPTGNVLGTPLTASGCRLYVGIQELHFMSFDILGTARYSWSIPNDRSLLRTTLFTQFGAFDPGANPIGLTTSNAYSTKVGGPK